MGGAAGEATVLGHALTAAADAGPGRELTHGFHTYPARMHPRLAREVLRGLTRAGQTVLDPFCGSGTVLVEARVLGLRALGGDVNPLAVRLARLEAGGLDAMRAAGLAEAAQAIATRAATAGAPARGPRRRGETLFDPHVFRELAGLRAALDEERDRRLREALELCLSAVLVKVSRRSSDTATGQVEKRLARGFASRLFIGRARELAEGLAALAAAVPAGTPAARIEETDARRLAWVADGTVDLVLTSPPYVGVYDYVEHQRVRYDWLGLDPAFASAHEIGARRRGAAAHGVADYVRDLGASLAELRRVLRPVGTAVLEVGDAGPPGRTRIDARPLVVQAAAASGFQLVAWAQATRRAPAAALAEHLLLLRPA